jgi:hypothetical protein
MKTKLEKYGFKDQHGHRLERCQDYLDIVDALEKAEKLQKRYKELLQILEDDGNTLADIYYLTDKELEQAFAGITSIER